MTKTVFNSGNEVEKEPKSIQPISELIRSRKSTYAYSFAEKQISKDIVEEIVTNALWAPTHKLTQPWRFEVLEGGHKKDLGNYMLDFYKENLTKDKFPESRYQETLEYPLNATLIAIIFQRSKRIEIPEWEEIAAVSNAVQNMWLSCTAMNLGAYWDSAPATISYCKDNLRLKDNEISLGIFYMGIPKEEEKTKYRKRLPLSKKLKWNQKQ